MSRTPRQAFWDAIIAHSSPGQCRIGTDATGRPVAMNPEQRDRGLYIVGKPGMGKTSLLQSLIRSDLQAGHGLAVINPEEGTFTKRILPFIPQDRMADVVYVDPLDKAHPVSLNPLHPQPGVELELCVENTLAVLQRIFDTTAANAPQMIWILDNAVRALMRVPNSNLFDVKKLVDKDDATFRTWVVEQVDDEEVRDFWTKRYPKLRRDAPLTLYSRLSRFLRSDYIAPLVCSRAPALDFYSLMESSKVLLFNLPDKLGDQNRVILGQLIVARLQQAVTLRREDDPTQPPFYIYLDEFHTFSNQSVASYETMLSRGRKRRAPLILAHQYTEQLNDALLRGILGTVSTSIVYDVSDFDARRLGREIGAEPETLKHQGKFHAHCRDDGGLHLITTPRPLSGGDNRVRDQVVKCSRDHFAVPPSHRTHQPLYAARRPETPAESARNPREAYGVPLPAVSEQRPTIEPAFPVAVDFAPKSAPRVEIPTPASIPGRGGQQHKYLQSLIARWAEANGWRAGVEERILDGLGSVDVALRKGDRSVACEVGISTSPEHEGENIQKCLAAGFERVVVVSPEKKTRNRIKALAASSLDRQQAEKVSFCAPEELFELLDAMETETQTTEKTVRGYKVKARMKPAKPEEKERKQSIVAGIVAKAMKRIRGTKS